MSLPGQIRPCHGSTIWDARLTSALSPIPRAVTLSIATRGCAASRAIAITTSRSTWAAATSICATTRRAITGRLPGSPRTAIWSNTPAATAWATAPSARSAAAFRPARATSCRWTRTWKSGSSRSPTSARRRPRCPSSRPSNSACGTRRTTPRTSSATSASAKWRSKTASSTTRPNTASGAITSPGSPARPNWRASTRSATLSWAPRAAGTGRRRWSAANPRTRWRTAGRPSARTTCAWSCSRAKRGRSFLFWAITRTPRTRSSIRPIRRPSTRRPSSR